MSVNIPDHFVDQYTTNVAHLLQIKGGMMRGKISEGGHVGEGASAVDQFGAVEMQEVVSRFAPMGRVDAEVDRRWVYPTDYELPQLVDTFDKLRLMVDPQGPLSQAAVKAAGRQVDRIVFNAFFADSKTGKEGGTTTTFDTTNHRVDAAIGASADTGLNVDKIIEGVKILRENNVEEDEPVMMAITPEQHADLQRQAQIQSSEFYGRTILGDDGMIRRVLGVDIVVSNLTPSNASYRLCPMWVRSGMYLGIWSDVQAAVGIREDISGRPYQLYTTLTMGATRLEEGRVIQIECTEA